MTEELQKIKLGEEWMEFATCAGYRVLTEGTGLLKKKDLE